eukprot:234825-Hanusia_phi.AAC.1
MMTAFNHTRCCHICSYRPRFLADLTRKVILDSEVSDVLSVLVELSAKGNCAVSYRASFGNDRLEGRARDNCPLNRSAAQPLSRSSPGSVSMSASVYAFP